MRNQEKIRGPGLSQKELAQLSGLTFQSISAYENGKRPVGPAMARKLAGPLGVDWTELVTLSAS